MKKKKYSIEHIEHAISDFYKVKVEDLYSKYKQCYPLNGARMALVWLLYSNGIKSYDIAEHYNITVRRIFYITSLVCSQLKKDTKIKEDINFIKNTL